MDWFKYVAGSRNLYLLRSHHRGLHLLNHKEKDLIILIFFLSNEIFANENDPLFFSEDETCLQEYEDKMWNFTSVISGVWFHIVVYTAQDFF